MTKSASGRASTFRPSSPGPSGTAGLKSPRPTSVARTPRILNLQYANSAEISRINKGLKRRAKQTVFGFYIDPRSGYWAKSEDEDPDVDVPPDVVRPVRIVPIVRDHKNALLFRFSEPAAYAPKTIATVQHALMRGIEVVFQLEEGEVLGEPLPARDNRRAVLAYEADRGRRRRAEPAGRGSAWPSARSPERR